MEKLFILHISINTIVKTVPQKVLLQGPPPSKFILLGEDDPDDQEMLKEVFASIDSAFILLFVDSGKEVLSALEKLHDEQLPCLIVLDYNMPGLNGSEILREVGQNERYKDIPKVVWSTSGSDKFKILCLELGAVDYVIKPSNTKQLERIARYMLSLCGVEGY
ncbi:MAG TPA: response regulator [Chitinophagaceae bacterium]|nr:response regulator [Chitinophagaceae bacterium]